MRDDRSTTLLYPSTDYNVSAVSAVSLEPICSKHKQTEEIGQTAIDDSLEATEIKHSIIGFLDDKKENIFPLKHSESEITTGYLLDENGEKKRKSNNTTEKFFVRTHELVRFATPGEKLGLVIGGFMALINGALYPCFTIMFGVLLNQVGELIKSVNPEQIPALFQSILDVLAKVSSVKDIIKLMLTAAGRLQIANALAALKELTSILDIVKTQMLDLKLGVNETSMTLIYLGVAGLFVAFLQKMLIQTLSRRIGNRVRILFFQSLISQDMSFFDVHSPTEFSSSMAVDLAKIESALGTTFSNSLMAIGMAISGFLIGIVFQWKLGLMCTFVMTPLIGGASAGMNRLAAMAADKTNRIFAGASVVVGEAMGMIRTVVAYNGQSQEKRNFEAKLDKGYKEGIRFSGIYGLGTGMTMCIFFLSNALAMYYGFTLVMDNGASAGDILTVFFSIMMAGMALGQLPPFLTLLAEARGAAATIYRVIDHIPAIDSLSEEGLIPESTEGNITFENTLFAYPGTDKVVLNGLNLQIPNGKTMALIGYSGCGKSTTVQLIERFYDPTSGCVKLDGIDVRTLNIHWLRGQIGFVGQQPILFPGTIGENIRMGAALLPNPDFDNSKPADSWTNRRFCRKDVTQNDLEKVAEIAGAHDFIVNLPNGYDTMITTGGAMLSGGQKQRIAIARALVRNPKVLLLDEATSALDSASEQVVQAALERASQGRTTIVIAHRLTTIRHADMVAVMRDGNLIEHGSPRELLAVNGFYAKLLKTQSGKDDENENENEILPYEILPYDLLPSAPREIDLYPNMITEERAIELMENRNSILMNEEDEPMEQKKLPSINWSSVGRLFLYTKNNWWNVVAAAIIGATIGGMWLTFAWGFGDVIFYLMTKNNRIYRWIYGFIGMAAASLLLYTLFFVTMALSSEGLLASLRRDVFAAIMRQKMEFFDQPQNSANNLVGIVGSDTAHAKDMTANFIGSMAMLLTAVGATIALSIITCWKLALLLLVSFPVLGLICFLALLIGRRPMEIAREDMHRANAAAITAIDGIQTVAYLGASHDFMDQYRIGLTGPPTLIWATAADSLAFGMAPLLVLATWGMGFSYGVELVENLEAGVEDMIKTFIIIIVGTMAIAQALSFVPSVKVGLIGTTNIFRMIDSAPKEKIKEKKLRPNSLKGKLTYNNLVFSYPTRPQATILKGLSVEVRPGQMLALIGGSGCGKSTLISLTERFYEARAGSIHLDDIPLEDLDINWLRSQIGFVGQEPGLFTGTVRYNVLYGMGEEYLAVITDDIVIEALKQASAWDFVSNLPLGIDTHLGPKGGALSGGQRQRIAIARCLVRRPKMLLLDDTTSALDTQAEKEVTLALKEAYNGLTTITITHRLRNIMHADVIAVFKDGIVAEQGTHSTLMSKGGLYYEMWHTQA